MMQVGWAFDIDDVLTPTALMIMSELIREGFEVEGSVEELHGKYGQPADVPGFGGRKAQKRIEELFNDPDFLSNLPVKREALDFFEIETIPIACYISSRLQQHYEVTEWWLKKKGFPGAPLVLRDAHERARDWKLTHLSLQGDGILGLVEDNKKALEGGDFKGKRVWLYPHQEKTPIPGIIHCTSWDEVRRIVKA